MRIEQTISLAYFGFVVRRMIIIGLGRRSDCKVQKNWARLPCQYCSKNVSGYRRHPRSVVAYSAEVVHHAVPIR